MFCSDISCFSFWWIIPVFFMIMCFLMMRSRRGSKMCGFGSRNIDDDQTMDSYTAMEILNKRYASGQINKDEYQEMKRSLTDSTDIE